MHVTLSGIVQTLTTLLRKMYETTKAEDVSEKKKLMEIVRCDVETSFGGMFD